mmetsp:Transcript_24932/g.74826  ORF Transcript_24932/g.74826 Transcript_24932/m.74826 type:complete len:525 (+) Transcript_24932:313-1887(+)
MMLQRYAMNLLLAAALLPCQAFLRPTNPTAAPLVHRKAAAVEDDDRREPKDDREAVRQSLREEQDAPGAPKDEVFRELWDRVSRLRSTEVETDRVTARNWRLGEERKMAAVELEDTRVCQTRLKGRTVAFGTAAGVVVLVDMDEGLVLDGFDSHTDEITALEWAGDRLVSGGADGAVVVYTPSASGESQLFELVEADECDLDDEDEDDLVDELYEALGGAVAAKGDADAVLARSRLYDFYDKKPPEGIIVEDRERDDLLEEAAARLEAERDGEPDVVLRGHAARVTGVKAVGDDADRVVSASLDKRVLLWDVKAGECREVAEARSAVCCLAVADGTAVVGLLDGSVVGYDLETGEVAFDLRDAHEGAVRALHYDDAEVLGEATDARGRLLCTGGADGVVRCYTMQDADGGLVPRSPLERREDEADVAALFRERRYGAHDLRGHAGAVVAVQADDTKLVSASIDGSVRCWDLRTGETLFALEGHSRTINSLHFEGPLLVSDGTDGAVIVHDFSGQEYEDDDEDWE